MHYRNPGSDPASKPQWQGQRRENLEQGPDLVKEEERELGQKQENRGVTHANTQDPTL